MRQNFRADKKRKEEMRKKKQEAKRNKRLNKKENVILPDQISIGSLDKPAVYGETQ